jgi:DNA-directed RNA polymerase II subunit RPB1
MNIFVPQSHETISEANNIVATEANITTSQFPRPIVNICQDNLTSGHLMTKGKFAGDSPSIEKFIFYDALVKLDYSFEEIEHRMEHIRYALKFLGEVSLTDDEEKQGITLDDKVDARLFSGYGLFSMILPTDLSIVIKNGIRTNADGSKEDVVIKKGVMIRGTLDKTALGNKSGTLVHIIAKDYSNVQSCTFVSHYQYITDHWFFHRGFSIGIDDCMANGDRPLVDPTATSSLIVDDLGRQTCILSYRLDEKDPYIRKQQEVYKVDEQVKKELTKAYTNVLGIMMTERHPDLKEMKINTVLNNVRDIGARIAKESLAPDNAMKAMIESGSKGNFMNIAQTIGLLGQQNVNGKRISRLFKGRTYPHFLKSPVDQHLQDMINPYTTTDRQLLELKKLLESRGFIVNSYIKGLTPIEFFTHQQGGREGLLSTAISTSTTGYLQRRIVKTIEDVKCNYLNMVVNDKNSIVQFAYGDDGMDNSKLVQKNGGLTFIDIARKVDQINNRIEDKVKISI